jgi:hypothetical protein
MKGSICTEITKRFVFSEKTSTTSSTVSLTYDGKIGPDKRYKLLSRKDMSIKMEAFHRELSGKENDKTKTRYICSNARTGNLHALCFFSNTVCCSTQIYAC